MAWRGIPGWWAAPRPDRRRAATPGAVNSLPAVPGGRLPSPRLVLAGAHSVLWLRHGPPSPHRPAGPPRPARGPGGGERGHPLAAGHRPAGLRRHGGGAGAAGRTRPPPPPRPGLAYLLAKSGRCRRAAG